MTKGTKRVVNRSQLQQIAIVKQNTSPRVSHPESIPAGRVTVNLQLFICFANIRHSFQSLKFYDSIGVGGKAFREYFIEIIPNCH